MISQSSFSTTSKSTANMRSRNEAVAISVFNEPASETMYFPFTRVTSPYTCHLVPQYYIGLEEIDENFDQVAWQKRVYGPDVIIVTDSVVPDGWILIDGNIPPSPPFCASSLMLRSETISTKEKEKMEPL